MRPFLKLSAACLIAVVLQWTIAGGGEYGDELRFALRVQAAHLSGVPLTDDSLLAAADELRERKFIRLLATNKPAPVATKQCQLAALPVKGSGEGAEVECADDRIDLATCLAVD